ncbi:MAG TPA: hypothetical protein VFE57_03775 [Cyclobacteriaceae bacterium]|jgi:hypothetical protein|nr:hypothetical protein [Cyclobacteriaceae bacterium]
MSVNLLMEDTYAEEIYQIPTSVTVVFTKAWKDISTAEKELLTKITEALRQRINPKLGLHAFRIVHVPGFDLSTWSEKPGKLIYFGPAIKGFSLYEVIQAGNTQIVFADALSDLIPNEGNRTKLWQALKQLFA